MQEFLLGSAMCARRRLGFAYIVPSNHIGFYMSFMGKLRPRRRKQPSQGDRVDTPGHLTKNTGTLSS